MILLSFDTEEFDVPREHGVEISLDEAMKISVTGTCKILDILQSNSVKATFFCTTNFAENAPQVMQRIINEGHEVAAHGCDHWRPQEQVSCFADKFYSKTHLEKEKSIDKARKSLERYGEEGLRRFEHWCEQFL